jgi:PAS domain S-box-containing protein
MMAPKAISGLRADGEEFPIEASISQVNIDSHNLFTVIIRDITSRRQTEDKLREQAALLDQAPDAIMVRDLEDRILFWNKGAERIYGWAAEEAVGRHVEELHYKELDSDFYEAKRILLERGDWSGEARHFTRSGETLVVESRWTLLRDRRGNPESVLIINTDITEKKRLEEQFLRAQRLESLGTLAGGIAHDINNILSPILMAIQLLEMKIPDEPGRRMLKVLQTNAERGGNLVRQILEFARGVEGERMILQPAHLVRQIVKVTEETFPKSIAIRYMIPESLWAIRADPTQIHQVLMNLLVNARDAMPRGGTITVEAENVSIDEHYARMKLDAKASCYIRITIRDSGTGIPAKIMDRVFDPFFTTKEEGKGTGLGLATVLTIVKGHGGFINLHSEEGKGTEFKVYLPVVESTTIKEAEEVSPELSMGHGELILVADDESAVREITRDTLERFGYKVLTADDGTEAIALFAQHREEIRVVLTDVMMPYMDGPATIRAIRTLSPEVKIIVSSGLKANSKATEAANEGANSFLSKPYTADKLLNAVAEVLAAT